MHRSLEGSALVRSTSSARDDSHLIATETIAAISTPPGEGAIALVRISGPAAVSIAEKIFRGKKRPSRFASHIQYFGDIVTESGGLIDEVMMSIHRAPASYTGEDIVEISCHGGTLVTAEGNSLRVRLDSVREQIAALLSTADHGRILRDGVRVVIYGATNAGKSSLLNRLLGYERVIVSDAPGTTRDTIEETINLCGVPVRLLDTAGLRTSTSDLEREGIARTERSLQKADLRLHIIDRNAAPPAHFEQNANGNELLVLNKCDLPEHPEWKNTNALRVSCLTGDGLGALENEILSRISKQNLRPENALAINMRHRDCLRRALEACDRARKTLDKTFSPEYLSVDLNEALEAVGEVIGTVGVEQILDSVFGQFCIGK